MTTTHTLDVVGDRPLVRLGDARALLDTAAPVSIGDGSPVELLGCDLFLHARVGNFDLGVVREHVGGDVRAVLGADVLSKARFLIEWDSGQVIFSDGGLPLRGRTVSVSKTSGVPFVEAVCEGRRGHGFIGTGSRLSYAHPRFVARLRPVAGAEDYYPGFGPFMTPVYRLRVEIAGLGIESEFGLLPESLAEAMELSGIDWIFGSRILRGGPVLFDLPASRVVLGRGAPSPFEPAWGLA